MEIYLATILPTALNYAPAYTSLCEGQTINASQNQAMFALLGNIYGGSATSFNLPDLRGRVPIGVGPYTDASGTMVYQLGVKGKGGTMATQLDIANLPAHSHDANSKITGLTATLSNLKVTATGSLPVNADPTATGTTNLPGGSAGFPSPIPDLSAAAAANTFYGPKDSNNSNMPVDVAVQVTQPGLNITGGTVATTIEDTGGNEAFTNMQPYLPINYLIVMQGIWPNRPD